MLDKTKTDKELGKKVNEYIKEKGVQTPSREMSENDKDRIGLISTHMKEVMNILGLDLSDDSLNETPRRIAKMWVNELFWGLKDENFPRIMTVQNKMQYDEISKDIWIVYPWEQ